MPVGFIKSAPSKQFWIEDNVPEICLLGRSNVGKSTLINALSKQKIALTSKLPGRTRMANFYDLGRFRLVDLPGYGYSRASKEQQEGFANVLTEYVDERTNLRCPILVVDSRHLTEDDMNCCAAVQQKFANLLVAVNKTDTLTMSQAANLQKKMSVALNVDHSQVFLVSAKKKTNVDALLKAVAALCI